MVQYSIQIFRRKPSKGGQIHRFPSLENQLSSHGPLNLHIHLTIVLLEERICWPDTEGQWWAVRRMNDVGLSDCFVSALPLHLRVELPRSQPQNQSLHSGGAKRGIPQENLVWIY